MTRTDGHSRLEVIERNGGRDRTRTLKGRFQGVAPCAKWLCFQCAPEAVVHAVPARFPGSLAQVVHGRARGPTCPLTNPRRSRRLLPSQEYVSVFELSVVVATRLSPS